jgi:hypothetical protein
MLDNQSKTLSRLHPPEEHPPLLLHPEGLPLAVPQLVHPIININNKELMINQEKKTRGAT